MILIIIKYTLGNKCLTQIIESYINAGGAFVSTYHNSIKEYNQFMNNVEKYHRYKYFSSAKEEFKKILQEEIKQTFNNYINVISKSTNWSTESFTSEKIKKYKDYILNNFEVKIVNLIVDKSCNQEIIYYFDYISKYIIL